MKHKLFLFTFLLAILSAINIQASERKKYNFNSEWKLRLVFYYTKGRFV